MTRSRRSLALLAGWLLAAPPLLGQGLTVSGTTTDPGDGLPVRGVRVALGPWIGAYSDSAGHFSIPAPSGRYVPTVSCPRTGRSDLTMTLPEVVVGPASPVLDIALAGGRDCLPALEAAGYLEATGILRGGETRRLELCDGPSYPVALAVSTDAARNLARRFGGRNDPRRPLLVLTVRGQLEGPGFFGHDGQAAYLLTVETIRSARKQAATEACR